MGFPARRLWYNKLTTILLIMLPVVLYAGTHKILHHKHWSKRYDPYFKKYSKHYFGINFPWQWFKAQAISESGLNHKAKSKAGAIGLMQIMPITWQEISKRNPHFGKLSEPRWNIAAGIFYDRRLYKKWQQRQIPTEERLSFMFASYNAGFTKVLKAWLKAKSRTSKATKYNSWAQVKQYTPGATRAYVHRIKGLMRPLALGK